MYRVKEPTKSTIVVNTSTIGETIEERIRRAIQNREPITDSSPIIYTERKDGVLPEYNIRADKLELAIEAMDKATKNRYAKRENGIKAREEALKAKTEAEKGTNVPKPGNPEV